MLRERLTSWVALSALLGLALLTALLAAALDGVTFSEGTPFDERGLPDRVTTLASPYQGSLRWQDYLLAYGPLGVLLAGFLVYILLRGNRWTAPRPRLSAKRLIFLVLFMAALAIIARQQIVDRLEESLDEPSQATLETAQAGDAAPVASPPAERPPASPSEGRVTSTMLQIALALVILGAAAALVAAAIRWRRRTPERERVPPDLTQVVDNALRELSWGRDAAGVVERCYRDMLKAYTQAADIDPATLTPREFAHALAGVGYNQDAIGELTSLFELVHYGGRPDDGFSRRATLCMAELRTSLPAIAQVEA